MAIHLNAILGIKFTHNWDNIANSVDIRNACG